MIKRNWRFKYIIPRLSKMASTKGAYRIGIKKLKYKKIAKVISEIIAFIIGLAILTIDIK